MLSTPERIRMLRAVIYQQEPLSVSRVAVSAEVTKGLVSRFLGSLVSFGVLKRTNTKFVLVDSPLLRSIRILLNLSSINSSFFKKYKFIESAGLYGSAARGTNTNLSDFDLWVKVKDSVKDAEIAKFTAALRNMLPSASIQILTPKKLNYLKSHDETFYHSLFFGSLILCGGGDGI